MSRPDFFISFNKDDEDWAQWIASQVERAGYAVVFQSSDFVPGSNFILEIDRALKQANRIIAVLSPSYLDSPYTRQEWAAALNRDPDGARRLLIPVRVRECNPTGLLKQIVYIDLVGVSDDNRARNLFLSGIGAKSEAGKQTETFPAKRPASRDRFPGQLPPHWNVSHRRNWHFVGRQDDLKAIEAAFAAGRPAALTGLGGVGKTQIAVEFIYRNLGSYSVIWWTRAENSAQLAADYLDLAAALGFPLEDPKDHRRVIESVRGWLGRNHQWLMIFDNPDSPDDLRGFLPQSMAGHAIITSRNPDWSQVASEIPVRVWDRNASLEFLVKRTGREGDQAAVSLADALGDLPLALEQAGAYIKSKAISFGEYFGLFQTRQRELLEQCPSPADYRGTLLTTWEVSFQEVRETSPTAAQILELAAFLASEHIPWSLLRDHAHNLSESFAEGSKDPFLFHDAKEALRRYSLANVETEGFFVHRLVQAILRHRLSDEDRRKWAEGALRIVDSAFPDQCDAPRTWVNSSSLLAHASQTALHAEMLGVAFEITGRLLNKLGLYLSSRNELTEAGSMFRRALSAADKVVPRDHPNIGIIRHGLGMVLADQGDLDGAIEQYRKGLSICEKAKGRECDEVATILNDLAVALHRKGDLDEARSMHEESLEIDISVHGEEDITVARDKNNLATVLLDQGHQRQSKELFDGALGVYSNVLGDDHPDYARALSGIGSVLFKAGDFEGAVSYGERSWTILEKWLGPDHPDTVQVRSNVEQARSRLGSKG